MPGLCMSAAGAEESPRPPLAIAAMNQPSPTVERAFNAGMGLLLVACGMWAVSSPPVGLLRGAGAVLLLVVGAQALLSAWRRRHSWLSRLGPLP